MIIPNISDIIIQIGNHLIQFKHHAIVPKYTFTNTSIRNLFQIIDVFQTLESRDAPDWWPEIFDKAWENFLENPDSVSGTIIQNLAISLTENLFRKQKL